MVECIPGERKRGKGNGQGLAGGKKAVKRNGGTRTERRSSPMQTERGEGWKRSALGVEKEGKATWERSSQGRKTKEEEKKPGLGKEKKGQSHKQTTSRLKKKQKMPNEPQS